MNADHPEFDALRRLLKLKRYEQPPPRFFNDFSGQVIGRIKNGRHEQGEDLMESLALVAQLWRRVTSAFRDGPMLAGASAAVVCALLIAGAIYTENMGQPPTTSGLGGLDAHAMVPVTPVFGNASPFAANQTNPATSLSGAWVFDAQLPTQPQRVLGRPLPR